MVTYPVRTTILRSGSRARTAASAPLVPKELCRSCPERLACLTSTITFEDQTGAVQDAVFGGLTRGERVELKRMREQLDAITA